MNIIKRNHVHTIHFQYFNPQTKVPMLNNINNKILEDSTYISHNKLESFNRHFFNMQNGCILYIIKSKQKHFKEWCIAKTLLLRSSCTTKWQHNLAFSIILHQSKITEYWQNRWLESMAIFCNNLSTLHQISKDIQPDTEIITLNM